MEHIEDIRELMTYNRWAHDLFLDAIEALPEGAADRELGSSFPTIRGTLAHMIGADLIWVSRWEAADPVLPPGWDDRSVAELRAALEEIRVRQDAFVDALEPSDLDRELHYHDRAGEPHVSTFRHMLVHVVNHATYHRGQLATLLRQVGAIPPSTDFIRYTRRAAAGGE
jgi:uncharacterized damage-inducible protein DinB